MKSLAYLIVGAIFLLGCDSPPPGPQAPATTPPTAAKQAINNAPADSEDWIDSSWKLFKSSLKTTFTTDAHKVRSPQGSLNFTHLQPIAFYVSNIDIVDEYKSPMHEPNVEHLVPISPVEAMHIWVKDRIRSVGADKTLQIIIKDASIISSPVKTPGGDTDDRIRRYDARLEVEMRIYGSDAMSEANVTVVSTQMITLSDSTSLDARKRIFYRMVYDLMESMNAELEKQIFAHFTKYIMYAQTP